LRSRCAGSKGLPTAQAAPQLSRATTNWQIYLFPKWEHPPVGEALDYLSYL
jgi:hypothetical protein